MADAIGLQEDLVMEETWPVFDETNLNWEESILNPAAEEEDMDNDENDEIEVLPSCPTLLDAISSLNTIKNYALHNNFVECDDPLHQLTKLLKRKRLESLKQSTLDTYLTNNA